MLLWRTTLLLFLHFILHVLPTGNGRTANGLQVSHSRDVVTPLGQYCCPCCCCCHPGHLEVQGVQLTGEHIHIFELRGYVAVDLLHFNKVMVQNNSQNTSIQRKRDRDVYTNTCFSSDTHSVANVMLDVIQM